MFIDVRYGSSADLIPETCTFCAYQGKFKNSQGGHKLVVSAAWVGELGHTCTKNNYSRNTLIYQVVIKSQIFSACCVRKQLDMSRKLTLRVQQSTILLPELFLIKPLCNMSTVANANKNNQHDRKSFFFVASLIVTIQSTRHILFNLFLHAALASDKRIAAC